MSDRIAAVLVAVGCIGIIACYLIGTESAVPKGFLMAGVLWLAWRRVVA